MLTKQDIITAISETYELPAKKAANVVNHIFDTMKTSLEHDEIISIHGFGTFSVRERAARKGRNPRTGEEIEIPARNGVRFKACKALREAINHVDD